MGPPPFQVLEFSRISCITLLDFSSSALRSYANEVFRKEPSLINVDFPARVPFERLDHIVRRNRAAQDHAIASARMGDVRRLLIFLQLLHDASGKSFWRFGGHQFLCRLVRRGCAPRQQRDGEGGSKRQKAHRTVPGLRSAVILHFIWLMENRQISILSIIDLDEWRTPRRRAQRIQASGAIRIAAE